MTELMFELRVVFSAVDSVRNTKQRNVRDRGSDKKQNFSTANGFPEEEREEGQAQFNKNHKENDNDDCHDMRPTLDTQQVHIRSYATEKDTGIGARLNGVDRTDIFIFFEIPLKTWPVDKRVESVLIAHIYPDGQRQSVISCLSFDEKRQMVSALPKNKQMPKDGPFTATMPFATTLHTTLSPVTHIQRIKRKSTAVCYREVLLRTPAVFDFVVQDSCVKELLFSANEDDLLRVVNESKAIS